MRVTLCACGQELMTLDADAAWQLQDVLTLLPDRCHMVDWRVGVRVFYGNVELDGSRTLLDVGASSGAVLTIVYSKLLLALSTPIDGSAKIWSAASGGCLRTLEGHSGW